MLNSWRFLTVEETIALHAIVIHRFGGARELIDRGKLEAAVSAPMATFDGTLLNKTIEEIAAAYWIGLCQAHAFLDGNKRVSLIAVIVFLKLNSHLLKMTPEKAEDITMKIAQGKMGKSKLLKLLKGHIAPHV